MDCEDNKVDYPSFPPGATGGGGGGLDIIDFWDANANTPDLSSLTLQHMQAYQVSVAGSTNLNGQTNWKVRDLAVWSDNLAGNWFKIDNTDDVISVFGRLGIILPESGDYNADQIDETATSKIMTAQERVDIQSNNAKVSADGSIDTHSDVDTTTTPPNTGESLIWDGSNWVPGSNYIKDAAITTTVSNNFNSVTPTDVPNMSFVLPRDGDYIVYLLINTNTDQNEEIELHIALDGVTQTTQLVTDRHQKNQDQSIQGTFVLDGATNGQTVTAQLNTRGDNVDLQTRRWLYQSWV